MHCKAQTLSFQLISMFFVVDQGSGLKNMISNIFVEGGVPPAIHFGLEGLLSAC